MKGNLVNIGVVGLGKLGLPLAVTFAKFGFQVVGLDINESHINKLNMGQLVTNEPNLIKLFVQNRDHLSFTSDYVSLAGVDIVYVIVPTPSDTEGNFSNTYIIDALKSVIDGHKYCPESLDIVIVSTVMPGTCNKIFSPLLRTMELEKGWREGTIKLIYSPEFIALGSVLENLQNPDMLLVGAELEEHCKNHLAVQRTVTNTNEIRILKFQEAEMVKLLVNCFVTMKISFANLIGEICDKNGNARGEIVAEALGLDSRIGRKYLKPGLGFGGPCFPRDNEALIAFCAQLGISHDLSIATISVNQRQPQILAKKIIDQLDNKKSIRVHGVSYKVGSDNYERSQMLEVVNILAKSDIQVEVSDPLISYRPKNLDSRANWIKKPFKKIKTDLLVTHQKLLDDLAMLEPKNVLILEH